MSESRENQFKFVANTLAEQSERETENEECNPGGSAAL